MESSSGLAGLVVMVLMVLKAKKNIPTLWLAETSGLFFRLLHQNQHSSQTLYHSSTLGSPHFGPDAPAWAQVLIAYVAYVLHPSSPTAPS